jgi:hypothetical protein
LSISDIRFKIYISPQPGRVNLQNVCLSTGEDPVPVVKSVSVVKSVANTRKRKLPTRISSLVSRLIAEQMGKRMVAKRGKDNNYPSFANMRLTKVKLFKYI